MKDCDVKCKRKDILERHKEKSCVSTIQRVLLENALCIYKLKVQS